MFAIWLFGFVYYACAVENPEISRFCVTKIRAVRTDQTRVKNVVLFCNTDRPVLSEQYSSVTTTTKSEGFFSLKKRKQQKNKQTVNLFHFHYNDSLEN